MQMLSDFGYRVQFPVDHSLLYDLDDMGWADMAVASLDDKEPKAKACKQMVKLSCARSRSSGT